MSNANGHDGTPSFRIANLDITVGLLGDGTPAIPGVQVTALIDILSRPAAIAKLDLSELQRLDDWISTSCIRPALSLDGPLPGPPSRTRGSVYWLPSMQALVDFDLCAGKS